MTVMPDPLKALDIDVVRAVLSEQGIEVDGDLSVTPITGGRSNLTYKVSDAHQSWVVRRPPVAGLTPSAHDVGREYRIMEALQGTAVPVPPVITQCADEDRMGAPFTVVGYVEGQVWSTQADLAAVAQENIMKTHDDLMKVLSDLHSVPYEDVGLADFGRPVGFVKRQIRRWRQQWDHVASRDLNDIDDLYNILSTWSPVQSESAIVHGDYRVDNTLLDKECPGRITALIDWEMAALGDPLTDLAMMCAYKHNEFDHIIGQPAASTSKRWPGIETVAEDYASASGRDISDLSSYLGLAYFKLAVIAEGIHSRFMAGAGDEDGYSTAGKSVPGLVAAGLAAMKSRKW